MSSYATRIELTAALGLVLGGRQFEVVSSKVGQVQRYLLTVIPRESEDPYELWRFLDDPCWSIYLHRGLVVDPDVKK